ncbi:MAG: hypothetical protein AAGF60_09690 [Pseudomonadota bacterium]
MTNMEELDSKLSEAERQQQVHDVAMQSLAAERMKTERAGYAVMSAAMNYGEASTGGGLLGKVTHGAQLFCIAFACAVPPFLVWYVLL